jgi:peptide/nickel transport system ATP-binding protein
MSRPVLLDIQNLSVGFKGAQNQIVPILRGINLTVHAGETIGIVGESGSGKSSLAFAAMAYFKSGLEALSGRVVFGGKDLLSESDASIQKIRGGAIALIPQNSGQALTPTLRIGEQISEVLKLHSPYKPEQFRDRTIALLAQVRLPEPTILIDRYPHELSGGQQQRVAIAMALAGEPELMFLDEPTTGLDVTTQAHILKLLKDICEERKTAMVYVSHDLGAVAQVCKRIVVMYAGQIVLDGSTYDVLRSPAHPYPRALLKSIPRLRDAAIPQALDGRPPIPGTVFAGCAFAERCLVAQGRCRVEKPELTLLPNGQTARCFFPDDNNVDAVRGESSPTGMVEQSFSPHSNALLKIQELSLTYARPSLLDQILRRPAQGVHTVENVTLALAQGETLGLVGESGSGKSSILKAIAGLLPVEEGELIFNGAALSGNGTEERSASHLRMIQLVFQNPDDSLNPRQTIAQILAQPLKLYFDLSVEQIRQRSIDLLEEVRLGAHYLERLPSQLSGGEKQRIAIARAFAADPQVVLCDEVTSALDVSVQAAVLELLQSLQRKRGTAFIFVSHDLAVVRALSDRVAVLYQGRLCEFGQAKDVYKAPFHPYTEALLNSVLEPDPDFSPHVLADDIVELGPPAQGCAFQRRCPKHIGEICNTISPPWQTSSHGHAIRCHHTLDELVHGIKGQDLPNA